MLSFVVNLLNYLLAIVFHFGLEEIFEKIFNLWILILYGNIYIYVNLILKIFVCLNL